MAKSKFQIKFKVTPRVILSAAKDPEILQSLRSFKMARFAVLIFGFWA